MSIIYLPTERSDAPVFIGTTNVVNPIFLITSNGVIYPNGYRITYNAGYREFFATKVNNDVYINCYCMAYGQDLPAVTQSIGVLIIG